MPASSVCEGPGIQDETANFVDHQPNPRRNTGLHHRIQIGAIRRGTGFWQRMSSHACGEFHKPAMRFGAGTNLDEIEGAFPLEQGLGIGVGVGGGDRPGGLRRAGRVEYAKAADQRPGNSCPSFDMVRETNTASRSVPAQGGCFRPHAPVLHGLTGQREARLRPRYAPGGHGYTAERRQLANQAGCVGATHTGIMNRSRAAPVSANTAHPAALDRSGRHPEPGDAGELNGRKVAVYDLWRKALACPSP